MCIEKKEASNIEKNKELFAYEMTEVILRLKGEYSVVSGKENPGLELAKEIEKKEVCLAPIPEIQMASCPLRVPETAIELPQQEHTVRLDPIAVDLAALPTVDIPAIPACERPGVNPAIARASRLPRVDIPAIPNHETAKIRISLPKTECRIPVLHRNSDVRIPSAQLPSMPNIPAFAGASKEAAPRPKALHLPDLPHIRSAELSSGAAEPARVQPAVLPLGAKPVHLEPISFETPKESAFKLPEHIQHPTRPNLPDVRTDGEAEVRLPDEVRHAVAAIPPVEPVSFRGEIPTVAVKKAAVEPTRISAPHIAAPRYATAPASYTAQIAIPKTANAACVKDSIPQLSVTAKPLEIAPLELDYEAALQEILDSALAGK